MEVRAQEHVMDHSPERRNIHNGTSILTYAQQTLDHANRTPHAHHNRKGASRYRECLKNHAASIGGNVYDGCGEFMPSGEEGTLEALKCAACECHRNFHRKEVDGEIQISVHGRRNPAVMLNPLQLPPPPNMLKYAVHNSPPSAMVAPMNVAFGVGGGGGTGTESSSEDLNVFQSNAEGGYAAGPPPPPYVLSKKRFRTKFSQDQKEKMQEFAEKLGWRINRQEEEQVEKFCAEVGVKRQVFKVWMHNNKNSARKLQQPDQQQQQE